MITNLDYIAENGVLMTYNISGLQDKISFSDITPLWDNATEELFEGGKAYIYDDDLILFTFMVAGGQDGIIVLWDARKRKAVHVSNAAFCVAATISNEQLLYLCEVSYFAMPTHYCVYAVKLGTMDVANEGNQIYCECPRKVEAANDGFSILTEGKKRRVTIGGIEYEYTANYV